MTARLKTQQMSHYSLHNILHIIHFTSTLNKQIHQKFSKACVFIFLLLLPPHADRCSLSHLLTVEGAVQTPVFLVHWQSISWRGHIMNSWVFFLMWALGSPLRLKLWLTRLQQEETCIPRCTLVKFGARRGELVLQSAGGSKKRSWMKLCRRDVKTQRDILLQLNKSMKM